MLYQLKDKLHLYREVFIICISKSELEQRIHDIRVLKTLKEETKEAIRVLENDVIAFLLETDECQTTDKKGKEIRQFRGSDYKVTYSERRRENIIKDEIKKLLNSEQFEKVCKNISYNVLSIKPKGESK